MNAVVKKLTAEDIPALKADGLNGEYLVEYGYYKVSLADDPSIYCYTRDFGGLNPDKIGPYLYVEKVSRYDPVLRIDLAAIHNDTNLYPVKTINVRFVESVPGENTKIFKDATDEKYYMRVSSYPREHFAKWMSAFKRQGRWEDRAEIRANVIFDFNGETERVTHTNWNGPAVYSENFNENFEKAI